MHNILICSANEDLLMALRAASGGGDVRLTVCRRGMEAVRALMALSFDRLILDLETPGSTASSWSPLRDESTRTFRSSRSPVARWSRRERSSKRAWRTIWCP